MSDSFLELKDLKKSFTPGEYVLQGINLKIEQGEFVTLLGSSGCGKTTTLALSLAWNSQTAEVYGWRERM